MSSYNPYEAPQDQSYSPPTGEVQGQITPMMLQHLRDTRPWVLFLSILGFIGLGLMVIFAIYMMAAFGRMMPMWMPILYIVFAAIGLVPTLALFRYAGAIAYVFNGGGTHALEEALRCQRSYWRFVGVMAAIMVAFYGLIFGGTMLFRVF